MVKRLGRFAAKFDTVLLGEPLAASTGNRSIGTWDGNQLGGRFRVFVTHDNPEGHWWIIAFRLWRADGSPVTETAAGLTYSNSVGGNYRYISTTETHDSFEVELPTGWYITDITAQYWTSRGNPDVPIIVRKITLQRLLEITLE